MVGDLTDFQFGPNESLPVAETGAANTANTVYGRALHHPHTKVANNPDSPTGHDDKKEDGKQN